MNLKLRKPLAVFDIETTGLDIMNDRLIELCIIKVMPDSSSTEKIWRVNPGIPIPPENSMIHGIYPADVADAPSFGEIAQEIVSELEGCDLGGYNLYRLDIPILVEEFLRVDIAFDLEDRLIVDVFKIFQRMEKRDLTTAYKFYCDKDLKDAHTASADTLATYEVLKAQLDRYDTLENDMQFLAEFTSNGNFIDTGRRLMLENGIEKFAFGKHRGKSVKDVLGKEPQYYDWIMRNNFLLDTKQKLRAIREKLSLN